jgi:amino acid permease
MLKFLGGTFLMIGAVIGGGILAIPIVSANFGFLTTLFFIIFSWMIMTKTGFYVLELSLSCPEKYNSYYSIVGKFLGDKVQILTTILFLWLLYFSLSSYISGCVSLIMSHLNTHPFLSYLNISIAYVVIFGSLIAISAKIIVRINVILVVMKLSLLLLVIFYSHSYYIAMPIKSIQFPQAGAWSLFLIIINAFGFQFIIPSLVSYYGRDNRVIFQRMLIVSTTSVLFLYIAWLYTIYSIIPMAGEHGLIAIYQSKNQLLAFNTSLLHFLHSKSIINILSLFQIVALFGSFFCVSLGVFDFLVDVFKARNRVIIGFATFVPPLLLTLFSENMYIYAMSAAGYIAIILEIIIPTLASKKSLTSLRTFLLK